MPRWIGAPKGMKLMWLPGCSVFWSIPDVRDSPIPQQSGGRERDRANPGYPSVQGLYFRRTRLMGAPGAIRRGGSAPKIGFCRP